MAKIKILFIVIDGLGDEKIPALRNKTPLESAKTPNLDFLAKEGICGLGIPVFSGAIPTSEEGHLALFGYDPKKIPLKRGYFMALGLGLRLKKGDVVLRGNFATVNENLEVIDRRAKRIKNTLPLIKSLSKIKEIKGIKIIIKKGPEYRICLILRGKNLSWKISDGDPFYSKLQNKVIKIKPLEKSKKASFTADVLNEFLEKAHQILKKHPFNKKREFPANYILLRGASSPMKIDSFYKKYKLKAGFIAGKSLYKGIGRILKMEEIKVEGATGLPNTNLKGKFTKAKEALKKYDFVFLHIKAADSLAEDGKFEEKKRFIEKIDKEIKKVIGLKNTFIVITADHSTCSLLKRHCRKPFPILIYGNGKDEVKKFSEKDCQKGKIGKISALKLMPLLLKLKAKYETENQS